jgi:Holliday junction resolvase RusA-like endonuclease
MKIETFISGYPKGQPRARAFARKMGAKFVARMYDSDVADEWKGQVRAGVLRAAITQGLRAIDGAFKVELRFRFERSQSHFKKSGELGKGRVEEYIQKPDLDNLAKLILDVTTRLQCCWLDDDQVNLLSVSKHWAASGKPSGCHIIISTNDNNGAV